MATAKERGGWRKLDDKLKYLAPLFMLLLIVYLYTSLVQLIVSKSVKGYLGGIIIGYFAFELFIKYMASDDFDQFIHEYWIDIVLLIPFLKGLRLIGSIGKALKTLKFLKFSKYIPYAQKLAKVPKMARKTKKIVKKYLPCIEPDGDSTTKGSTSNESSQPED